MCWYGELSCRIPFLATNIGIVKQKSSFAFPLYASSICAASRGRQSLQGFQHHSRLEGCIGHNVDPYSAYMYHLPEG